MGQTELGEYLSARRGSASRPVSLVAFPLTHGARWRR